MKSAWRLPGYTVCYILYLKKWKNDDFGHPRFFPGRSDLIDRSKPGLLQHFSGDATVIFDFSDFSSSLASFWAPEGLESESLAGFTLTTYDAGQMPSIWCTVARPEGVGFEKNCQLFVVEDWRIYAKKKEFVGIEGQFLFHFVLTLRIIGPSYRGTWTCIAGFWDLKTASFEIPWFLG